MRFRIYRLRFRNAVHFGIGKLATTEYVFQAPRMFSALCGEALHIYGEESIRELADACKANRLRLSDAFPYFSGSDEAAYYIPKPIWYIEHEKQGSQGDSTLKKQAKKLKYIDLRQLDQYLGGDLDVQAENQKFHGIGREDIREMSGIHETAPADPYPVGTFRYGEGWGLYIIVGYADDEIRGRVEELLRSLSYSGIGGKRTAGLGQFELTETEDFPHAALDQLRLEDDDMEGDRKNVKYILLSSAMTGDADELEAVLRGASYSLGRTGGYIDSTSYADTLRKKKDYYYFKSGSVMSRTFRGQIADVSHYGNHPVYGYYMPIFLETEVPEVRL